MPMLKCIHCIRYLLYFPCPVLAHILSIQKRAVWMAVSFACKRSSSVQGFSNRGQTSRCAGSCSAPHSHWVSESAGSSPHFSKLVLHLDTPTRRRLRVLHTG
uniref:Secreted protein n=1 Tax=Cacopsylla melanoneura TaxID=428564 RepID=A0A8D8V8X5_9HEMI